MGWWKINKTKPSLCGEAAQPKRDSPENHMIGSAVYEVLEESLAEVRACYQHDWGRQPYPEELDALWIFATTKFRSEPD